MNSVSEFARMRMGLIGVGLICVFAVNCAGSQYGNETHFKRSTLRVGFWTLWHDRKVQFTPIVDASFRTCETCSPIALRAPAMVRAAGDNILTISTDNHETRAKKLFVSGVMKIAGHGEEESVHAPIAVTARSGVLSISLSMPIEDYVERVVASESGPEDSLESLKALAIVVRSYAQHEQHGHPDYDVCDSTHCQLLHWHGVPERRAAAHRATLETAGETLWFRERRAVTYFTKDCGGQSAAAQDVWQKSAARPYLTSQADTYCARTPGKRWESDLSRADVTAALAQRGLVAPGWNHLQVDRRSVSGRAITIRADTSVISAEDFRIAVGESLGWNLVQSNWFEISESGGRIHFHGRGSGHGVGLCQKGAALMGANGRNVTEILGQYFPGAYAADETTGKRWSRLSGSGFVLDTLDSEDSRFLPELAQALAEVTQRSGLHANSPVKVKAFASLPEFRDAALAPGWMAAFEEGDLIATQPLRVLASRHQLPQTMRHEFLHVLIEERASPNAPMWLREGLAELWSSDSAHEVMSAQKQTSMKLELLDSALRKAKTESQSHAAHRDAAIYSQRLLDQFGRERVLSCLISGVPTDALFRIGQR